MDNVYLSDILRVISMKMRDLEVQAVYQLPRVKSFIDSKNTRFIKTGSNCRTALVKLNRYVTEKYSKDANKIIDYLAEKPNMIYLKDILLISNLQKKG